MYLKAYNYVIFDNSRCIFAIVDLDLFATRVYARETFVTIG